MVETDNGCEWLMRLVQQGSPPAVGRNSPAAGGQFPYPLAAGFSTAGVAIRGVHRSQGCAQGSVAPVAVSCLPLSHKPRLVLLTQHLSRPVLMSVRVLQILLLLVLKLSALCGAEGITTSACASHGQPRPTIPSTRNSCAQHGYHASASSPAPALHTAALPGT